MKTSRLVIFFVTWITFFCTMASSCSSGIYALMPGSVCGIVTETGNNILIENVRIELRCIDAESGCDFLYKYYISNMAGNWFVSGLAGSYILTASKPGYQTLVYTQRDTRTGEIIERKEALEYPLSFTGDNQSFQVDIEMAQCLGDTNGDQEITAADALIAFDSYLQRRPTAYGFDPDMVCCDVNKDGQCTPADALCIFYKYLEKPSCLD
ncbi:MAG: dockerin type I domain-containing protein [Desulfobacterales bacterium]